MPVYTMRLAVFGSVRGIIDFKFQMPGIYAELVLTNMMQQHPPGDRSTGRLVNDAVGQLSAPATIASYAFDTSPYPTVVMRE